MCVSRKTGEFRRVLLTLIQNQLFPSDDVEISNTFFFKLCKLLTDSTHKCIPCWIHPRGNHGSLWSWCAGLGHKVPRNGVALCWPYWGLNNCAVYTEFLFCNLGL